MGDRRIYLRNKPKDGRFLRNLFPNYDHLGRAWLHRYRLTVGKVFRFSDLKQHFETLILALDTRRHQLLVSTACS